MRNVRLLLFSFCFFFCLAAVNSQVKTRAYVDHLVPDGIDSIGGIVLTTSGGTPPYSYTWTPGNLFTKDYPNVKKEVYSVKIKSAGATPIVTYNYEIGYKVLWGSNSGTEHRSDTLKNNEIYTIGSAISKNTLRFEENGWFELILNSGITLQQIGFIDSAFTLANTCTDIDFGVNIGPTSLQRIAFGTTLTTTVSFSPGDVFRLERIGSIINYKLNGLTLWTVTNVNPTNKNWKIRAAEDKLSSPIVALGCSFGLLSSTSFPNFLKVNPSIIHSSGKGYSDGSISLSLNNQVPAVYTWPSYSLTRPVIKSKARGEYSAYMTDNFGHTQKFIGTIAYKVDWTDLKGAKQYRDTLINTNLYAWGSGISKNTLKPYTDGWLEMVCKEGVFEQFGFLDSAFSTNDQADMDFGIYKSPYTLQRIVNGAYSPLCSWQAGDVIRIERISTTVNFKLNGVVIWTNTNARNNRKKWNIKAATFWSGGPVTHVGCSFIKPLEVVANRQHVESSHPVNGTTELFISGGTPPYKALWKDSVVSQFRSDLVPGIYKVLLSDSASSDTISRLAAIGVRPNWIYTTNVSFTPDTAIRIKSDSLGIAIAENMIIKNKKGWIESKVNSLNEEIMIGFVGDDFDLGSQSTPYIAAFKSNNTSLLYTLLKNAIDNTLSYPNHTLTLSTPYQKIHAIRLKNGLLTPLMNGSFDSNKFPYTVGDIIKVGRDASGNIYVTINDVVVYTNPFIVTSQYLYPQFAANSVYYKREYAIVNPEIDNPPITPATTYAIPRLKLDGGFYTAISGNVYFAIEGEYNTTTLYFKILDKTNNVVLSNASSNIINNSIRNIGDNRYILNVSSLPNGMYVLEVTNEKGEKVYLRFKQYVNVGNGGANGYNNN